MPQNVVYKSLQQRPQICMQGIVVAVAFGMRFRGCRFQYLLSQSIIVVESWHSDTVQPDTKHDFLLRPLNDSLNFVDGEFLLY